MKKIIFDLFERIMAYDITKNNTCIEIEFLVDGSAEYDSCWLGKLTDKDANQVVYWFGLTPDGSQAHDFNKFIEFVNAPVFHGQSIKEIWDLITIIAIDGCEVDGRLSYYINSN